ncbi:aldehyde dehydrogenase family protein [Streptomyces sp. NPDC094034]|uniref:aldehyde dehydrogenase family protein n=1 Tax=Streptomyces sp. NPDC094034 TaxID=3155309 RepID=UPI003327BCD5
MTRQDIVRCRWSSDDDADRFTVDDPSTGQPWVVVQGGGAPEVDRALRAARVAQRSWSRRPVAERSQYLLQAARAVREHADELAELEAREVGKPLGQARLNDLPAAVSIFEFFAGVMHDLPSSARASADMLDVTVLAPYGVVAGIIPFNWPPIHAAGKIAPALAVGNAVVVKPPEQAPMTILRIVELLQDVLPDDVVHALPGGSAAGAALVSHPLVGKLSFTGAPATGSAVLRAAADNLTPAVMELGGKNAMIVFADADLDAAVATAVDGGFFNQGEACTAASRLLVERPVYETFLARFGPAVARLRVGASLEPGTHVGPLVTAAQQRSVLDHLALGRREGARVVAEAALPEAAHLAGGFYVAPTVFADVRPDMRIAREEIFGPVVTVIPFDTEDEAVTIANDTDFGLVGSVFTGDNARALRVADGLDVGIVTVNNYDRRPNGTPFGGVKHSGFGREHAKETLAEFGYSKTVRLPVGQIPSPRWSAVAEVLVVSGQKGGSACAG